jgi:hypothetical protein
MTSPEDFPAEANETGGQPSQPAVIICLRQRVPSFLEAANDFEGVTAEVLPLDTRQQARLAAGKFCVWKGSQDGREAYRGVQAVADNIFESRDEFSVLAISGSEAYGLDAFRDRAEALEQEKHPDPGLSSDEYLTMEHTALTGFIDHLQESRARLSGGLR